MLEPPSWAPALPTICGKDIIDAAKKFKRTTGLGADSFNPRWLCMLSDGLVQGFAGLLGAIERVGAWPAVMQTVLIAQIPKSDGGRRPIGLLPTLVRVWEKVRKPIVSQWRATIHRSYNYADRGKSAQAAAWKQALHAEAAAASGGFSVAGLVDLTKAFEMVRLDLVWAVGLKLHCPPEILRLELEAFAMARRLTMLGVVTEPVLTLSAVLAGGAFATDALFLLMVGPCDRLLVEHPGIEPCLFVDDLTLHAMGQREADVVNLFDAAVTDCIVALEQDLQLVVSRGKRDSKTIAIASNTGTSSRMSAKMAKLGVRVVHRAKLLGIDYSEGRKVRRGVQRSRIKQVLKRKQRYLRIGRRAAAHLVKTGAGPALRYGTAVVGASCSAIKAARGFSCQALGEMRGKSTFGRLSLANYDVGGVMATDPIVEWAKAGWDGTESGNLMTSTWKKAMIDVGTSARPFGAVKGPAGAMVASALRIGWKVPSPFCFLRGEGELLDIRKVAPYVISQLALHDLRCKEAAQSSLALRIGGPPDLEPLKAHIHSVRRTKAAGSLRALGEGGWWTQARMHAEQLPGVEDDICKACNAAVGTLYHRCCECPATVDIGRRSRHHNILSTAQSAVRCLDPFFQHGIPHLRSMAPPPPFVARWCGGVEVDDFSVTGSVFTDGALSGGARKGTERAGWAVVVVGDCGLVIGGLYGTCPDHFPTSLRAELWALLQALRHARPPLTIWVDNAGVVDGLAKGRTWCCHSSRPAADLWLLVWDKLEDLDDDRVVVLKVKAHATQADVDSGRTTAWHRQGNDHADHFAKRGSDLAEHLSPTRLDRDAYLEAKKWYAWLTLLVAHWPNDTQRRKPQRSVGPGGEAGGAPRAKAVAAPSGSEGLLRPHAPLSAAHAGVGGAHLKAVSGVAAHLGRPGLFIRPGVLGPSGPGAPWGVAQAERTGDMADADASTEGWAGPLQADSNRGVAEARASPAAAAAAAACCPDAVAAAHCEGEAGVHKSQAYQGSMGASGLASGSLVGLQRASRGSGDDSGGHLSGSRHPLGTAGGPREPPRCPAESKMVPKLSVQGGGLNREGPYT